MPGQCLYMSLYVGLYDPSNYPSEWRKIIEAVNGMALRILKYVEKMDLRELIFYPGRDTARIDDIMTIIERKVQKLDIHTVPLGNWVHRLQYHERMTSIELCRVEPRDEQTDAVFWTAISKLPNVTTIKVDSVPLWPALNLQFPHIISLKFHLWPNTAEEWACSFVAIFTQMPNLETLHLLSPSFPEFEISAEVLSILRIECKNLRNVILSSCLPKGLLATLGRHCPNLMKCIYESRDVDDEDLRQISRCQDLCFLHLKYAADITSGVAYLANLRHLNILSLHYSTGKYIDKQLLLDFARSCPDLKSIMISDWNNSMTRSSQ